MNIAIVGATGSIGQAFIQKYNSIPNASVYAFSRSKVEPQAHNVFSYAVNFLDDNLDALSEALGGISFDRVIVTTGILHDETVFPEKKYQDLSRSQLEHYYEVNTVLPALIAKFFIPRMSQDSYSSLSFLSARVGSISDNRLGGWYGYRMSKAALNMLIKTLSIETKRLNPNLCVVGLHPGTVASKLSQPFQKNVLKQQLFSPEQSVDYLLKVINSLTSDHSGRIFDWAGEEIHP